MCLIVCAFVTEVLDLSKVRDQGAQIGRINAMQYIPPCSETQIKQTAQRQMELVSFSKRPMQYLTYVDSGGRWYIIHNANPVCTNREGTHKQRGVTFSLWWNGVLVGL